MALNGFSVCAPSAIGNYRVPGTTCTLAVRREVAPLLIGLAGEFHRLVEPITINPRDDWGYACRRVRGRTTPSFHAAGIAIDLNATRHPLGRRNTFNARQRATCRALAKKYGCRWGGDYTGRADEMHFEVIVPRAQALTMVRQLQASTHKTPAPKAAVTAPRKGAQPRAAKLRFGADNSDVVLLQQRLAKLGYKVGASDGSYGAKTRAAVRAFQTAQGWSGAGADGLVGELTLERLF